MNTWKQIRLVLPLLDHLQKFVGFLFLCFFCVVRGRSFCFKLIGSGVRKGGTPGLGKITGTLKDCSMGKYCNGSYSLRKHENFHKFAFRDSGDPCAVLGGIIALETIMLLFLFFSHCA